MADIRQFIKSLLTKINDLPNIMDAPASFLRTFFGVYTPKPMTETFGPEHLAADACAIGASVGFVAVKAAIDIGKEIQYYKRGTASYLEQQIERMADDLVCAHQVVSDEERENYRKKIIAKLNQGLEAPKNSEEEIELQKLADQLFGEGAYIVDFGSEPLPEPLSDEAESADQPVDEDTPKPKVKRRKIRLIKNKAYTPENNAANIPNELNLKPKKKNSWEIFVEKALSSRLSKIIDAVWDSYFRYALFYWIGWAAVWIVTGIETVTSPLAIGLTFGLPLIVPAITLAFKLGRQFYKWWNKDKPQEVNSENHKSVEKLRRQLQATKLIQNHYSVCNEQLESHGYIDKFDEEKAKNAILAHIKPAGKKARDNQANSKPVPKAAKRLTGQGSFWHSLPAKIGIAGLSGAMMGYILAFFMTVPLTSFLTSLGVITAATPAAPIGIAILSLSILASVIFALKDGTKASSNNVDMHNLTLEKYEQLQKLKQEHEINKHLRFQVNQNHDALRNYGEDVANPLRPQLSEKNLDKNPHFWEALTLKPKSKWNTPINAFNTACVWFFTSWTGSLFIRSLFMGTGVFALINPAIGLPVIATMGITLGIIWGTYRLATHFIAEQQNKDIAYVQQAKTFTTALEAENAYLLKLDKTQKGTINAKQQEKTHFGGIFSSPQHEPANRTFPTQVDALYNPHTPGYVAAMG